MTDKRDKARAVLLAAAMIFSVFGGTMAFAGAATATASNVSGAVGPDLTQAQTSESFTINVTIDGVNTSDTSTDAQFELDLSDVDLTGVQTSASSTSDNVTDVGADVTNDDVVVTFNDTDTGGDSSETVPFTVDVENATTPSEGEYDVNVSVDSESDGTFELQDETIGNLTVDGTPPAIDDVQISDLEDDNDLVTDGERVLIEANVTDAEGVASVEADAEAFGIAEPVELTPGDGDTYSAEFTVDGENATDGDQIVTITATDTVGNTAEAATDDIEVDVTAPENPELDLRDEDEVLVKSHHNLDVVYGYLEENTQRATITLEGETYHATGETYTYELDDEAYINGSTKSITLDLDDQLEEDLWNRDLDDGAYSLTIEVEDEAGNVNSTSTEGEPVVVDDEAPHVTGTSLNATEDVAPDDTLEVTYDYADATNATELTLVLEPDDEPAGAITADVDHESGDDLTQTFDLSDANIDDNEEYEVYLTAEDEQRWTPAGGDFLGTIDVNAAEPSIESVEANAGEDSVTVEFSEAIDDWLDRTDLAYQDVNGDGASAIDHVDHYAGSDEATLYLDDDVSASDLETDVVSARAGEIPDTADHDPRYVDSGEAVALQDTTEPTIDVDDITAETISQGNEENYAVDVSLDREVVDVTVTVGNDVEATQEDAQYFTTVGDLNVSELADGDAIPVSVLVTDKGGNTDQATAMVEKDTASPSIESVQANAGTDTISVEFDEEMSNLDSSAFDLEGVDANVDYVRQIDQTTFDLDLGEEIPFDAINDSTAANVTATEHAEDAAGNPAEGTPAALDDTEAPTFWLEAAANDENVSVQFSEGVVNATGDALDADDFVYNDESEGGASAIESVEHDAESDEAIVTLDAAVTGDDLGTDELGIAEGAVVDANDNVALASNSTLGDHTRPDVDLGADVDGDTITYTIESDEELDEIDVAVETEHVLETERAPIDVTLTEDDFELESDEDGYVYTAEYTAPRDGQYDADLHTATDLAGNDGAYYYHGARTDVDTADPAVSDARLAFGHSEVIAIDFDEPIEGSTIDAGDVSVDGASVNWVDSYDDERGKIFLILEEPLQTGDEPDVTVDGDAFTERANDSSTGQTTPTTVHTGKLSLSEGTNFVSVPAVSGGQDLDDVDTSNVDVIWTHDEGEWQSYDPDASENDFDSLEGGQGYIVEMEDDDVLDVNVYNLPASSTGDVDGALLNQQQLDEGWNLVGHYQTTPQSSNVALSSISESVHLVYGQQESYEYGLVGSDDPLVPGEAYWVFVTDDEVYTFTAE